MLIRRSPRTMVALICALFLIVAGQFFWTTPILEGPDSGAHFKYVRFLLINHRFPVLNEPDPANAPAHEAGQFPLYYLLAAAASFPVSTADFHQVVADNPHAGDMRGNGNSNFLFHRPFTGFPHGTELAARIVELLSLVCGALTVACAVVLGLMLERKRAWLGAAAGVVLIADPPFDAFFARVTNDTLVTALSALTLVLLACWVSSWAAKWSWLAATALSLAILAKFSAVGLVLPYIAATMLAEDAWRRRLLAMGKLAVAVAVVDGWWIVRNQLVLGDFSGMLTINSGGAQPSSRAFATPITEVLKRTLGAMPDIWHALFATGTYGLDSPAALYLVTTALGSIGLIAGVIAAVLRLKKERWLWLVFIWPAVNFAELWGYAYLAIPPARYLLPSFTCLALLVALGWMTLLRSVNLPKLGWPLAGAGIGVALLVPPVVLKPAYAYPATLTELPASARPVHAVFADAVELIGAESSASTNVEPGVPYGLTLYWRLKAPTDRMLDAFVHIDSADPGFKSGASYDGAIGGGTYPPAYWQPGQIVVDRYTFTLDADKRADQRNAVPLAVRAGLTEEERGKVPAEPPEAADEGLEVARWKLAGHPPDAPVEPLASFAGPLDLVSGAATPAGPAALNVELRWRAREQPGRDFTAFVQLLSSEGKVLAQHDSYPLNGRYPTTEWSAGEQVFDTVQLPLKEPLVRGDRVIAGLYVLPDSTPIPTAAGAAYVELPIAG